MNVLLAVAFAASTLTSTIAPSAEVHVNVPVTFSETYPKEAARQTRQPQYPNNPVTQINCAGFGASTIVQDKHPITGGWSATTYPVTITVTGTCVASLYSGVEPGTVKIWAQVVFEVLP